ncbi:fumarylacetoacetase [Pseudoduganella albidiflava]|uniref:fumarylacetoacetase n=1 Tax=Pseudoduganella albidiflava TaxID=321983 RepID=A0A411X0N8_9BURK|nr:fumarylacetoacetase [Pseudoduganella albidiflava]QBI02425.1 fumarylacetoacetase [Pseudoduganella albidiflava]GGY42942.1 fumarylacetoacetase [Pseudoduganella albidiflava]
MSIQLNETHDAALTSWVKSANEAGADFPIQNLPFAVFRRAGSSEAFRGGVAIGDQIVDLSALGDALAGADSAAREAAALGSRDSLNALMAAGPQAWSALRLALSRLLRSDAPPRPELLVAQSDAEFTVPATIGDYTDFYTSIHHATAVGKLFRPDNPLLPNYKWVPIGYHGRSSTIGVSGQAFHRPRGQTRGATETEPVFGPARRMDFELEVGIFVGGGNAAGEPIAVDHAEEHVFGLCLLNDWSARDLQAWEYQPLGPFLSKNFATTISPWIVTTEALAPYRAAWQRDAADPQPLPYLDYPALRTSGGFDIELDVLLQTETMRREGQAPAVIATSNFRHSYWTVAQLVAHHTVNGCALRPGDLLGSGTQSGPKAAEAGSLLELSAGGKQPLTLPNGEQRVFLDDGDRVVLRGRATRPGLPRIGFGEASGTLLAAR